MHGFLSYRNNKHARGQNDRRRPSSVKTFFDYNFRRLPMNNVMLMYEFSLVIWIHYTAASTASLL